MRKSYFTQLKKERIQIGELILRYLSKSSLTNGVNRGEKGDIEKDPLALLRSEYSNFSNLINGKNVVDFGCGAGTQAIALQKEENCNICAVDTNANILLEAKKNAADLGVNNEKLNFHEKVPTNLAGSFDVVISQNAMEHFPCPEIVLEQMKKLIHSKGKIFITFGPPWFAPYGSHMQFFCNFPWVNVFFSEKTVMNVRALYRNDGAKKYEEVASGLNKMSLKKFKTIVNNAELHIEYLNYNVVKGQNWLAKIPFLNELVVNHVTAILIPKKC